MKFIYTVLLFMIFVNIFTFLFINLELFPYDIETGDTVYNLSDINETSGESVFQNLSELDFEDVVSLSRDNVDLLLVVGAAIALSILMRSPAIFATGLFTGVFINTFRNSTAIFTSIGANEYLVLAAMVGVIFLIVITIIEYMTQGDV